MSEQQQIKPRTEEKLQESAETSQYVAMNMSQIPQEILEDDIDISRPLSKALLCE